MSSIRFFHSGYKWYFPSLIIGIIIIGSLSAVFLFNKKLTDNKASLLERSAILAELIDIQDIDELSATQQDLKHSTYNLLKTKLMNARAKSEDVRFIYLMVKKDNEYVFLMDSEDPQSSEYSAPGDVYVDYSPAIDTAFTGIQAIEGPISDSFGHWISSIAPIFDNQGKIIAILGIDVNAKDYIQESWFNASIPIVVALFLICCMLVGWYFRQVEANRIEMKSQFVALASHEIRSPLTGILWALHSIDKDELSENNKHFIDKTAAVIHTLIETVNDILDATSLTSKATLKDIVVIKTVLDNALESLQLVIEQKKAQIVFEQEIPLNTKIKGDVEKIKHLFINVISNALKYSPEHSQISIGFLEIENMYRISFKDQGIGIPASEKDKILNGFYRASNVRDDYNGSGLGLYFVKKVMQAHKGVLKIESEINQGTKIILDFPIIK
jgi:signal transduction histidine kinase